MAFNYFSIYLVVSDYQKSLDFYDLCLMNAFYDEQHPEQMETRGPAFPEYDDTGRIAGEANNKKIFMDPDGNPIEICGGRKSEQK